MKDRQNHSRTFAELQKRAKETAAAFLKESEISGKLSGGAVAFYMEKSVDAVVVMMAGVYCGAYYSFVDVRQPSDRAKRVIEILDPALIITDDENAGNLKGILEGTESTKIYNISSLLESTEGTVIDEGALNNRRAGFIDTAPLYVNFTSGSTGDPKGVMVSHRSVIDFIEVFTKRFDITCKDVLANQAPFDFDVLQTVHLLCKESFAFDISFVFQFDLCCFRNFFLTICRTIQYFFQLGNNLR